MLLKLPPAIQIDFVGSRTPSPVEESLFDWSVTKKQYRFKTPIDQQSNTIDTDLSINDFEVSEIDDNSITRNSLYGSSKVKLSHTPKKSCFYGNHTIYRIFNSMKFELLLRTTSKI